MFAIPASMLTWGFEAEAQRVAAKSWKLHLKEKTGEADSDSSSISSSDDYDSDEEYFKYIAGEDGSDNDDEDNDSTEMTNVSIRLEESHRKLNELAHLFQEKIDRKDSDGTTMTKENLLGFFQVAKSILSSSHASSSSSRKECDNFDKGSESSLVLLRMKMLEEEMNQMQRSINTTNERLDQILELLSQK